MDATNNRTFWGKFFPFLAVRKEEVASPAKLPDSEENCTEEKAGARELRCLPSGFFIEGFYSLLAKFYGPDRGLYSEEFSIQGLDNTTFIYTPVGSIGELSADENTTVNGSLTTIKKNFFSIRMGYFFRFSEPRSSGEIFIKITQLIADIKKVNPDEVNREYNEIIRISEYSREGIYGGTSIGVKAEFYNSVFANFAELKDKNNIIADASSMAVKLNPSSAPTSQADTENTISTSDRYVNLIKVNDDTDNLNGLDFYDGDIDLVYFSEADLSFLYSSLTLVNPLVGSNVGVIGFEGDVFFSGAKLDLGRVFNPFSQIEMIALLGSNGDYPDASSFTLKAETVLRDNRNYGIGVRSVNTQTSSGKVDNIGITNGQEEYSLNNARLVGPGTNQGDGDTTIDLGNTIHETVIPAVITALPCPNLWHQNDVDEEGVTTEQEDDISVERAILRQVLPIIQDVPLENQKIITNKIRSTLNTIRTEDGGARFNKIKIIFND